MARSSPMGPGLQHVGICHGYVSSVVFDCKLYTKFYVEMQGKLLGCHEAIYD